MNRKFGDLFVVPKPVAQQHQFFGNDQGLRIKDLMNPTKKMSKSDDSGKGVIFLGDEPEAAHKKIMNATTDSLGKVQYDRENQPGISNLLEILTLVRQDDGRDSSGWATASTQQLVAEQLRLLSDHVHADAVDRKSVVRERV